MNLLIAAKTGHGKGYHAQAYIEQNLDEYDYTIILDPKDEYRGLVEEHDRVKRFIVGPNETAHSPKWWAALVEKNGAVQLPKHELVPEDWREVCGTIIEGARSLDGSVLVCVEEAHEVAPQDGSYPESVKLLATKGRGELASSLWITQRLAELDKTVVSQSTARLIGASDEENDLKKLRSTVGYPVEVHNPQNERVPGLPEELHHPEDGAVPVQKYTDEEGNVTGSEWIYSDDDGRRERRDTSSLKMQAPHRSPQGKELKDPEY